MKNPLFVKGDLDGFFGLAVDNLVQILVISALCSQLCGFSQELIYGRMLPGVAVSLLVGNLFYAIHARLVARRDKKPMTTALPYGINTPSVFAYILFIMAPVYNRYHEALGAEKASDLAWKAGLVACLGSGLIEFLGAFIGGWVRRNAPRAALLSCLAAIGVILIAGPFAFQIFERPLIAIVPMMVVLIGYFARVRMPLGIPSGFAAVLLGTALAWLVPLIPGAGPALMSSSEVKAAYDGFMATISQGHIYWPQHCWNEIVALFRSYPDLFWTYLGIIIPMGLMNAIGSLQNIESAEAAGDRYATGPCMAVNGIGTLAAGFFGSCFPTTIYIGHPGWKALGACSGYSIINGLFFTAIFLLGLGPLIVKAVPIEAGMAIVMWIGIIITAQSYEAVPKRHYPAVAIGFFPAVATLVVLYLPQIMAAIGAQQGVTALVTSHVALLENAAVRTDSWWPIGIFALAGANSGFILTSIFIAAISAFLIDRRFKTAAGWCAAAAIITLLGFQHAYRLEPDPKPPTHITVNAQELLVWQRAEATFKDTPLYLEQNPGAFWHRGYRLAIGYGVAALLLVIIHWRRSRGLGFADLNPENEGTLVPAGGGSPPALPPKSPAVAPAVPTGVRATNPPPKPGVSLRPMPIPPIAPAPSMPPKPATTTQPEAAKRIPPVPNLPADLPDIVEPKLDLGTEPDIDVMK